MKIFPDFHKSTGMLHMNCERPRSYYIPFADDNSARGERTSSPALLDMCGEWDFRRYPSADMADDVLAPGFTTRGFDKITVPSCWQMYTGRGYDAPQYTNFNYPFPLDPPHVPDDIPAGLYVRSFDIPADRLKQGDVYIVLEGVDCCFYMWINGDFAMYSTVSHGTSEMKINDYLMPGENTFKILVLKWGASSYLEDQDMWRMSGIFRPLYLLFRPREYVRDAYLRPYLDETLTRGRLDVALECEGAPELSYRLIDPQGRCAAEGSAPPDGFELELDEPQLWSDEAPALYELFLYCKDEVLRFTAGFRRIEIKDGCVTVNGRRIKLRGVNHHDTHPVTGHALSYEQLLCDLRIIKANNFNCVRTAHYPADPRFYDICDRLGLWVVDEADLETHGCDAAGNRSLLSDDPAWQDSYLDRAERLFERDKNHPCVIMWSLGNESGFGCNQRAMSAYIRARDNTRLIHYEGANTPQNDGVQDAVCVDIESMMYPPLADCAAYLADRKYTQPLFLCEYCHSMGNSPGDLAAYNTAFDADDRFLGGCIWEFCDHAILRGTKNGRPDYAYGGDFGEIPNDGNFCCDGLLRPDRSGGPAMDEARQAYSPLTVTKKDDGSVGVFNRRFFTDSSDIALEWSVEVNGYTHSRGALDCVIGPRAEYVFMPEIPAGECVFLNIRGTRVRATEWAEAGSEVFAAQLEYARAALPATGKPSLGVTASLAPGEIVVRAGECLFTFDKERGRLVSLRRGSRELLRAPLGLCIWRAPADNDRIVKHSWYAAGYFGCVQKCYDTSVVSASSSCAVIASRVSLGSHTAPPALFADVTYTVRGDGSLEVAVCAHTRVGAPALPRLGLILELESDFSRVGWFGYGPGEAYADKRLNARMGRFECAVDDNFTHYPRPQENGSHYGTLEAVFYGAAGTVTARSERGFSLGFSRFTPEELTTAAHDCELVPGERTVIHLDGAMSGVGSNSCGPALDEAFLVPRDLDFAVTLSFGD